MKKYLNSETRNADAPLRVDSIRFDWMNDDDADVSFLTQDYEDVSDLDERHKYLEQDKERLEAYHRGDWSMMGCRATAVVSRPIGQGSRRLETFTSGGLWGIESDCGPEYRNEVEGQELSDLRDHLAAFGVTIPEDAAHLVN